MESVINHSLLTLRLIARGIMQQITAASSKANHGVIALIRFQAHLASIFYLFPVEKELGSPVIEIQAHSDPVILYTVHINIV